MRILFLPKSLVLSICLILCLPAIAFASLQAWFPSDPDKAYTKHGKLTMEWVKFADGDGFTEYIGKDKTFDEEVMKASILVMRNYVEPQQDIYDHSKVVYSSIVIHQTINCLNRTIVIEDLMLFSKRFTKGAIVKDLYDLNYESSEAKPETITDKKVKTFCNIST